MALTNSAYETAHVQPCIIPENEVIIFCHLFSTYLFVIKIIIIITTHFDKVGKYLYSRQNRVVLLTYFTICVEQANITIAAIVISSFFYVIPLKIHGAIYTYTLFVVDWCVFIGTANKKELIASWTDATNGNSTCYLKKRIKLLFTKKTFLHLNQNLPPLWFYRCFKIKYQARRPFK